MTPEIPFKRQAVEPVQCLKNGWELVKDQYWLFVGMTFVGVTLPCLTQTRKAQAM